MEVITKKISLIKKGKKNNESSEVKKFIMFYERLTKHMLKNLSRKANYVIKMTNNTDCNP